jgi:hypothetical protein
LQQGGQVGARLDQLFGDDFELVAGAPEFDFGKIGVELGVLPASKRLRVTALFS